ncbi:MAG TPA: hemolysin family protein [Anaerolineales bacterium]|jgi:CBS domain containing-hemolysin-like protein
MISLIGVAVFLVLVTGNGLLAAAGSALKNSHVGRLRTLESEGERGAATAARVASGATRLIVSLRAGHGALRLLAFVVALVSFAPAVLALETASELAFVGVVAAIWILVGSIEFVFENLALRAPVTWALRLAPLVVVVEAVMSPLIWLMLRLGRHIARSPMGRQYPLVTEEEIMTLVNAGHEGGVIQNEERSMIYSILQLSETLAREVMVPRIDVLAFDKPTSLREATATLLKTGYSRAPVYDDTIDDIVGLLYVKDLLAAWREGVVDETVADLARDAYFVPEAKRVDELLTEMQAKRIQMAIVVDEYGGTAGLVTFEDIVEEIVGEVRDEYDVAEELPYQRIEDDQYLFNGGIDLDDVNQLIGSDLPKDTSETLGGFIYSQLGRVPHPGETLAAGGLQLVVEQVVGRRIRKVRATRFLPVDSEAVETGSDGDQRRTAG